MTQHRLASVAVASVAAVAASLCVPTAAHADSGSFDAARVTYGYRADNLRDFDKSKSSPFDGARARIMMLGYGSSTFDLKVRKVRGAAGKTYNVHLHVGPCRTGKPAAALGHYNIDEINKVTPVVVSPQTEVWLPITIDSKGRARSATSVPFVVQRGEHSIVIHDGTTPDRLACLPITVR